MQNSYSNITFWMAAGLLLFCGVERVPSQEDKANSTARKALMAFWSKVEANDLEGALKATDIPFCFNPGNPDQLVEEVARDRESLKKLMKGVMDGTKRTKAQLKFVRSLTYAEFLKETGDILKKDGKLKKDRLILDEVLKKDGHVVMTTIREELEMSVGFLIAAPKGEAKVVGILAGLTNPKKE